MPNARDYTLNWRRRISKRRSRRSIELALAWRSSN